jgi:hypothetical protein
MTDRLVENGNHALVIEETNNIGELSEIFRSFTHITASSNDLMEEFIVNIARHRGLDFSVISYYRDFVAPSNLEGYSIVGMQPIPPEPEQREMMRPVYQNTSDHQLGSIIILAARPDVSDDRQEALLSESNKITSTRINYLRNL